MKKRGSWWQEDWCIYVCENDYKLLVSCSSEAVSPPLFMFFHLPHSFPCCEQLCLSIISIKNIFGRKSKPSICEAARRFPFRLQALGMCPALQHPGARLVGSSGGRGFCTLSDEGGEPALPWRWEVLSRRKQDPSYQYWVQFCKSINWFEFERILNLDFSHFLLSLFFLFFL